MWIQIIGPSGSGKTLIVEHLQRNGFDLIAHRSSDLVNDDAFYFELVQSSDRLKDQIKASDLMDRTDVITVRSFWDSHEVFINVAHHFQEISDYERKVFAKIYEPFIGNRALKPPHAVVYMKMPEMSAYNRMLLRNVDVDPDRYNKQVEFYHKYVEKIGIPVLEIDGSQAPDAVVKQLEFDLSSIRATNSSGTIWQKEYLRQDL